MAGGDTAIRECERWFIRRGVPHFIADYDASSDIWTRSLPLLLVLYLLRGLYALDLNESIGFNLLATVLVLAVLAITWPIANRVRGRPAFSWPRHVGAVELAVFVIAPEIPALLLGQWADALKAIVLGLLTLLVVYFATSYALVPILRWAGERSVALLDSLGTVMSRALPLLLVSVTFLFLAAEVWQTLGSIGGLAYGLALGLFFLIGGGFLLSRLPGDVASAGELDSWAEVRELVQGTAAAELPLPDDGAPPRAELSRRESFNVALVGLFARSIQILLVGTGVGLFLIIFGALVVTLDTTQSWTQADANVLLSWTVGSREVVVTEQLLRVAGFLATFAALSFTVYLVTDPTYRGEFRTDIASELREAFAVRAAYRWTLQEHTA